MGSLGVAGIAWVYTLIKEDRLSLPRLHKKQPPPTVNGVTLAGSVASKVYLDSKAGTATKEYNPPWPVRVLYWLAFQAPFPYDSRRDALESAAAKRKIAGLLTKHRFGQDMVAPVHEVRNSGGKLQFVTELVSGSEPESNGEVEETLARLYDYFQDVGLPTWQIAPGNPHAYSNFIRNAKGELKLIDIELSIVSFSPPFSQLRSALRDGLYPVFDDVDFVRLRKYVTAHASELGTSLGPAGLTALNQAVDSAETFSHAWKRTERRIWGRIAQRVYRLLDMSGPVEKVRHATDGAERMAQGFMNAAVDRWEREGKIDGERAAAYKAALMTSEVQTLLKHMGAHLVLSVAVAIPIPGLRSAARFGWTLAFRIKAMVALIRGRITKEEYQVERSIHSVPVMLVALVPGFGAVAYGVSDSMMKRGMGRMLIDQSAHKMPFGLYRRMGLARITAPQTPNPAHRTPALPQRILANSERVYERLASSVMPPQSAHSPVRVTSETGWAHQIPRDGYRSRARFPPYHI